MTGILWLVGATVVALGVLATAAWLAHGREAPGELPPGETMPTTPLQRLAARSFLGGLAFAAVAAAFVVSQGPHVFSQSDRVRLSATAFMLAAVGVLAWFGLKTRQWARQGDSMLDERDQAILGRAPAGQSVAILVVLATWMIALTEAYHQAGMVPTVYLYLIFWSCLLVSLLALPIGVLVGYRRS